MASDSTNREYSIFPAEFLALRQFSSPYAVFPDRAKPGKLKKLPAKADYNTPPFDFFKPEKPCLHLTDANIGVTDLDKCFRKDGQMKPWAVQFLLKYGYKTTNELSVSGTGCHLFFRLEKSIKKNEFEWERAGDPNDDDMGRVDLFINQRWIALTGRPLPNIPPHPHMLILDAAGLEALKLEIAEMLPPREQQSAQVAATQQASSKTPTLNTIQAAHRITTRDLSNNTREANQAFCQNMGFDHSHKADQQLAIFLVKYSGMGSAERLAQFEKYKLHEDRSEQYAIKTLESAVNWLAGKNPGAADIDPDSWREGFYSFGQLPKTPPRFLIPGLVPEKALTAICASSYNYKTWLALAMAFAISTGQPLWSFGAPTEPVPVAYHVPEMNAAFVRRYMELIGFEDSEMFLVRPMELGLWKLDDPRMCRAAEGRMNIYDTAGYFNPADDSSNYQQSLKFANLLYNLLQNGAVAVAGLFHPPKYAKAENQVWTLENSILGSAGYGGILRSCLRMQNLNPDLNDPDGWIYVQGMKNPGLKPFQLCGPPPLKMKVPPGESPYLKDLNLSGAESDLRREKAFKGFAEGKPSKVLIKELHCSPRILGDFRRKWTELNKVQPIPSNQIDLPEVPQQES